MNELIIDIKGFQNLEMEVARHLKKIEGKYIENISLNEKGQIVISYRKAEKRRYAVKQIAKRKYQSVDEYIKSSFEPQRGISGRRTFSKKWVIEQKKIWLVFFER